MGQGEGYGVYSNKYRGKAQRSGFGPEEEVQRNEQALALRARARDMEFAPTM